MALATFAALWYLRLISSSIILLSSALQGRLFKAVPAYSIPRSALGRYKGHEGRRARLYPAQVRSSEAFSQPSSWVHRWLIGRTTIGSSEGFDVGMAGTYGGSSSFRC
jgi:hypothetical protein